MSFPSCDADTRCLRSVDQCMAYILARCPLSNFRAFMPMRGKGSVWFWATPRTVDRSAFIPPRVGWRGFTFHIPCRYMRIPCPVHPNKTMALDTRTRTSGSTPHHIDPRMLRGGHRGRVGLPQPCTSASPGYGVVSYIGRLVLALLPHFKLPHEIYFPLRHGKEGHVEEFGSDELIK